MKAGGLDAFPELGWQVSRHPIVAYDLGTTEFQPPAIEFKPDRDVMRIGWPQSVLDDPSRTGPSMQLVPRAIALGPIAPTRTCKRTAAGPFGTANGSGIKSTVTSVKRSAVMASVSMSRLSVASRTVCPLT